MSIKCPQCGREYDVSLFQFGRSVVCECGRIISRDNDPIWQEIFKILEDEEEERVRLLQRLVDRISRMIVSSDYPDIDIDIEIEKVRRRCRNLFPGKEDLFSLIYESRFQRLREQFRN